jgi:hypothetical protein
MQELTAILGISAALAIGAATVSMRLLAWVSDQAQAFSQRRGPWRWA